MATGLGAQVQSLGEVGTVIWKKDLVAAERMLDLAMEELSHRDPRGDLQWGNAAALVASYYRDLQKPEKATAWIAKALPAARVAGNDPAIVDILFSETRWANRLGRYAEAAKGAEEAVAVAERMGGTDGRRYLNYLLPLWAEAEERLGHIGRAEELLVRDASWPGLMPHSPPPCAVNDSFMMGPVGYPYGLPDFYIRTGRPEKAEAIYREYVRRAEGGSIAGRHHALRLLDSHLRTRKDAKKTAEAREVTRKWVEMLLGSAVAEERACGEQHRMDVLADYSAAGDFAAAEKLLGVVLAEPVRNEFERARVLEFALLLQVQKGDMAAAEKAFDTWRATGEVSKDTLHHWKVTEHRDEIADGYWRTGRFDDARRLLRVQVDDTVARFGKGSMQHTAAVFRYLEFRMERKENPGVAEIDAFLGLAGANGNFAEQVKRAQGWRAAAR